VCLCVEAEREKEVSSAWLGHARASVTNWPIGRPFSLLGPLHFLWTGRRSLAAQAWQFEVAGRASCEWRAAGREGAAALVWKLGRPLGR